MPLSIDIGEEVQPRGLETLTCRRPRYSIRPARVWHREARVRPMSTLCVTGMSSPGKTHP